MRSLDYVGLSKKVSYALRHAPWEFELEMDEEGKVPLQQLLDAFNQDGKWGEVTEETLRVMMEQSEKKRFEIKDGTIRAYYGHSIPMRIVREERMPPDILYHGTAKRFLDSIMENGLLPKGRQYVHLSQDVETAQIVGRRRDDKPVILKVDARRAWEEGVKFYYGNEKVWLADCVEGKYLELK